MKIISIDTSGKFCSVSISLFDEINEVINSEVPLSHSSELAVNIKRMIDKYDVTINDLDFIIINIGPGSFTGLRIGVSFAKGLSLSNDIPLIPVNSFQVIKSKINTLKDDASYHCIYSHKDYAYGKKYDLGSDSKPELINLKDDINIPIYISGLESSNSYKNNIIDVKFNSLDLFEIGKKYFKTKVINNINSINPMYIDYTNVG